MTGNNALRNLNLRSSLADRGIAAQRIDNEQAFSNHGGSITGQPWPKPWTERGQLSNDEDEYAIWTEDMADRTIQYVIRSFTTPIAWLRKDIGWYVTDRHYSSTTTKHIGIACNIIRLAGDITGIGWGGNNYRHPAQQAAETRRRAHAN